MTQIALVTAASAPASTAAVAITPGLQYVPTITVDSLETTDGTVPLARIAIEDSANGTTGWMTFSVFHFAGASGEAMQTDRCYPQDAIAAHVRTNLLAINGTVSYQASV